MIKKISLVLLALLFATTTALAEGFYAGAGAGLVKVEDSDQGESFDDTPFGWKIFAGYDFNENFAFEGSYIKTGEAEDEIFGEPIEAELSAFTFSALGLMPVSDSTQIFGKLGYYTGEQEVTAFGITVDDDDDGFLVGAGIRFMTSDKFAIRADFDWYDSDLDSLWSIGAAFQFYFGQ